MPMKFKQIQAFITVAREGNMTLAAEKMGITQSGLSRLLLSLEADLPLPHDEKIVVRGKINWQDRICIVARQHHPLHQAADVTLEAMLDYPWIMPPPSSTPMNIQADIFRARQLPCPQPVIECASSSAIKAFLCESDLLTSMPAPVYRHEEALGLLRPFELEGSVFIRDFYAYSHFGVLSGAALQLIQHLKQ